MNIGELLLDKKYTINNTNNKEEIYLMRPSTEDIKSYLCIHFNYTAGNTPEYAEYISYIKIFNVLPSNIIQLKINPENIFQTRWTSYCGNIASGILFSKIDIYNEKIYMAKIMNNLTYDDYINTIKLIPTLRTDITVYFYKFKIKSFIILVLKSIITPTREYIFHKMMNNKIYYDMSNFKVNIVDFYKEISDKSPGEIINPYYEEYPYSYQCF